MTAYSLFQKMNIGDIIPYIPDQKLGYGADGDVFSVKDHSNKVIKFSVLYDYPNEDDLFVRFHRVFDILRMISTNQDRAYARVYEYGLLGSDSRDTVNGKQKYILYYYVMERLRKISEDEKRIFHTVLSHRDSGEHKDLPMKKIAEYLHSMRPYYNFSLSNALKLCQRIKDSKINHNDIHERNIMKDYYGRYKLVDFDRAILKEY